MLHSVKETAFLSFLENLSETKFKSNGLGLVCSTEEIIQDSLRAVLLLSLIALIQVYSEKEQEEHKNMKNVQFSERLQLQTNRV